MSDLTNYDPAEVEFESLRFRGELRTAIATGDHPEADATVTRSFGADIINPTILKDGEELLDAEPPALDRFEDLDERLEGDGMYAVLEGVIDGHTYTIRLEARDDDIRHTDGSRTTRGL